MAQSNLERVGRALELLNKGLKPFIEREMLAKYGAHWQYEALKSLREQHFTDDDELYQDTQGLLLIMWDQVEQRLLQSAGACRTQFGERFARYTQQVGTPESIQHR